MSTIEETRLGMRTLTFSLAIVWMTSSGGVPKSSVMIENWWTSAGIQRIRVRSKDQMSVSSMTYEEAATHSRSLPGKSGFPSSISAKMQPALRMSTATSYFCHVNMISGARYHRVATYSCEDL